MNRVDILAVGREILTGRLQETNSHWLIRRLTLLGGEVKRVVVVDDEIQDIAREVRRAVEDKARVVVTTGGLGPTFDDRTLEGVGMALGRRVEFDPEAIQFVEKRYKELHESGLVESTRLTPERRKMGRIPSGSLIFPNPVGTAPAVMLRDGEVSIFCLPGVPHEMKQIFEESVIGRLKEIFETHHLLEEEIETRIGDESKLAEVVERVMKRVPSVHLKSLPTTYKKGGGLKVRVSVMGANKKALTSRLSQARRELLKECLKFEKHPVPAGMAKQK
jgi:molybdenum cofactor synthesis domain-containing protein